MVLGSCTHRSLSLSLSTPSIHSTRVFHEKETLPTPGVHEACCVFGVCMCVCCVYTVFADL